MPQQWSTEQQSIWLATKGGQGLVHEVSRVPYRLVLVVTLLSCMPNAPGSDLHRLPY
jgi:hypothetical protein